MSILQEFQAWGARRLGPLGLNRDRLPWIVLATSLPLVGFGLQRWIVALSVRVALPMLAGATGFLGTPPELSHQSTELDARGASLPTESPAARDSAGTRHKGGVSRSVSVPAGQVLGWVRARAVPKGRSVPPTWYLPRGVEIRGATAFGVGLSERDRLVVVDGQPVASGGDVIEAVLRAVGRQAPATTGIFMREAEHAVVTTTVVVQFPGWDELQAELERADKVAEAAAAK